MADTLGVLAQLQAERDEELLQNAQKDIMGKKTDLFNPTGGKYTLKPRRKGPGKILREQLLMGASPDELELLRQFKISQGGF